MNTSNQRHKPTKKAPKVNRRTRAKQPKSLSEQSSTDFDHFFDRCDGLTYIFLTFDTDTVNTVRPDLFCGIALAHAAFQNADYDPPYAARKNWGCGVRSMVPRSHVEDAVKERVREMHRRGEFVMLWNMAGEKHVRVDCSDDLIHPGYCAQVAALLTDDVDDYLFY